MAPHLFLCMCLLALQAAQSWTTFEVLDLHETDPSLGGFSGGFSDGVHGFVVSLLAPPVSLGGGAWRSVRSGKVARFSLEGFKNVMVLDLAQTDPELRGFYGGFSDGEYGYVVPYLNNEYAFDSFFGKVARFPLQDFNSVEVLDLTLTDPELKGFRGGFTDGQYGYVMPSRYGPPPFTAHGKVARFRLHDFTGVQVLDLTLTDPDLKAFEGGFTSGQYGYALPWCSGKVARFLLRNFSGVEVLDLTRTDPTLSCFRGGFTDGQHGYLVPSGPKIVRFRLQDFGGVEVLDFAQQVAQTDPRLELFREGFTDGQYGYILPRFGNAVRFRLSDFSGVEVLDLAEFSSTEFAGGFTDGRHGYLVPFLKSGRHVGTVVRFGIGNESTLATTTRASSSGTGSASGTPTSGPASPELVVSASTALLVAAATACAFGFLARVGVALSKSTQGFGCFAAVEFLDVATDIGMYVLCIGEGDLRFRNDEGEAVATALLASTSVNFALLLVEFAANSCGRLPKWCVPWLICFHLMSEDCFQLVLYTIVTASQAMDGLGDTTTPVVAVMQCSLFIIFKLKDAIDWGKLVAAISTR